MLLDYCLMSLLLVLAHLLRYRVPLLGRIHLPTPIIAGALGLLGGEQVMGIVPFSRAADGNLALAAYPGVLVALLFATLYLGARQRSPRARVVLREVGDTFFYNLGSECGQYAIALLFGLLLLAPAFPGINAGFALMLPAGFVGGHGTVTAMGQVLQRGGWPDALTVGYTFATVGLLSGIIGGMLLINLATKRAWTRLIPPDYQLPVSMKTGFVPPGERQSTGQETVSPTALDTLAWHVALVLTAVGMAYFTAALVRWLLGWDPGLPLFAIAILTGALLQKTLDVMGLGGFVDRTLMERIGSTISDYLVAFAVASIEIAIVVEHALPLILLSLLGIAYSLCFFWFLGRRMLHNYWFERSLFTYGWNTGVVGIGVALLRVVDPRLRSGTLQDFGLAYVGISFVAITIIVTLPQLVVRGYVAVPALVLAAVCAACILLSRYLVGWFLAPADQLREGEEQPPPHAADGVRS